MPKDLPQQPIDHPRLFAKKYQLSRQVPIKDGIELWEGVYDGQTYWVYYFPLESQAALDRWTQWQIDWDILNGMQLPNSLIIPLEGQKEINNGVLAYPAPKGQSILSEAKEFSELELALLLLDMSQALIALNAQNIYTTLSPSMIYRRSEGGFALHGWGIESLYEATLAPHQWADSAYKAPESFDKKAELGAEASVFALGVSLYQLASGKLAFGEKGGASLSPLSQGLPQLPKYSARFNHILGLMMAYKADRRPSADTLFRLANTFIKEQTWKSVGGLSFGPNLSGTPLDKSPAKKPAKRSPKEQKESPKPPKVAEEGSEKASPLWLVIIALIASMTGLGLWWSTSAQEEVVSVKAETKMVAHLEDLQSLLEARMHFAELIQAMEAKPNLPPTEKTFLRLAQMQLDNLDADLDKKLIYSNTQLNAWKQVPDPNWLQQIQTQLNRNIQNLEYLQ
ncbi:MAG: hypothetical protein AAFN10_17810 [Bacteroidota bacterium]